MPTSTMVADSLHSASNHFFPSSYAENSERKDWYVGLSFAIGSSGQYFRLATKEAKIALMRVVDWSFGKSSGVDWARLEGKLEVFSNVEDMVNMSSEDLGCDLVPFYMLRHRVGS